MEKISIIVFVWSHYRDEQNLLSSSIYIKKKKKVIFTRQGSRKNSNNNDNPIKYDFILFSIGNCSLDLSIYFTGRKILQ